MTTPANRTPNHQALELVNLLLLMQRTAGHPSVGIGVVDGPVDLQHPGLDPLRIQSVGTPAAAACQIPTSIACNHGTFVLGQLAARRQTVAPGICPNCTFLVRPIFAEAETNQMPVASPTDLAAAITETVSAGARIVNLSMAVNTPTRAEEQLLTDALTFAVSQGAIVVAAAGNDGMMGSSVVTRHPGVIPVVATDLTGWPHALSNLGRHMGARGLRAPGAGISSLGPDGALLTLSGTSVAAPFVTGTIALLWSLYPGATAADIKLGLQAAHGQDRRAVVPPLLNAWQAYQALAVTPT